MPFSFALGIALLVGAERILSSANFKLYHYRLPGSGAVRNEPLESLGLPGLAGIGDTSARAAFVVGTDGVVKYAEQTATPKDLPDFPAIKAALAR